MTQQQTIRLVLLMSVISALVLGLQAVTSPSPQAILGAAAAVAVTVYVLGIRPASSADDVRRRRVLPVAAVAAAIVVAVVVIAAPLGATAEAALMSVFLTIGLIWASLSVWAQRRR